MLSKIVLQASWLSWTSLCKPGKLQHAQDKMIRLQWNLGFHNSSCAWNSTDEFGFKQFCQKSPKQSNIELLCPNRIGPILCLTAADNWTQRRQCQTENSWSSPLWKWASYETLCYNMSHSSNRRRPCCSASWCLHATTVRRNETKTRRGVFKSLYHFDW